MRLLNRTAGRISKRRRGPLATFVVLLMGLLLTGTLYSAFAPANAAKAESQADMAAKGRQLFLVGCAFCHGQNGQGQLDVHGNNIGPTLIGTGAASVDFQVSTGRMPLVQSGQQAPQKEVAYSDTEIAELAAYVASLGPGPSIPTEADYSVTGLTDAQREAAVQRGGQIFLTNCTACHNFEGSGGAMPSGGYAPRIRGVEPRIIYEAMLTGPQAMPTFSNGNLSPEEKRDVISYIGSLDTQAGYGGFGMGGFGPVAEGLFAWLFVGGIVAFAIWIAAHTTRTNRKKKGQTA